MLPVRVPAAALCGGVGRNPAALANAPRSAQRHRSPPDARHRERQACLARARHLQQGRRARAHVTAGSRILRGAWQGDEQALAPRRMPASTAPSSRQRPCRRPCRGRSLRLAESFASCWRPGSKARGGRKSGKRAGRRVARRRVASGAAGAARLRSCCAAGACPWPTESHCGRKSAALSFGPVNRGRRLSGRRPALKPSPPAAAAIKKSRVLDSALNGKIDGFRQRQ